MDTWEQRMSQRAAAREMVRAAEIHANTADREPEQMGTVSGVSPLAPDRSGKSYGLQLSGDGKSCTMEWQWLPDMVGDIHLDKVIRSDQPLRVQLMRLEGGVLTLRIGPG
jgi:hypothetical protein